MTEKEKEDGRNHLDRIYSDALEITEAYNCKYIPLNTLKVLLDASKPKDPHPQLIEWTKKWVTMIDNLYTVSDRHCKQFDLDDKLPMITFKKFINVLKENL